MAAGLWMGLRAYKASAIGSRAIRLRRSSDNLERDFVTVTGGGLDLVAITAWKGAANLFVVTLYDQIGNAANNFTQATPANQPAFTLGVVGGKPAIDGTSGATCWLNNGGGVSSGTNHITMSTVFQYKTTADGGVSTSGQHQLRVNFPSAGRVYQLGGTSIDAPLSADTWHAGNVVYGTSADLYIDGASLVTGNIGAQPAISSIALVGFFGGNPLNGYLVEYGLWDSALTTPNRAALNTNQHTYWGF
jgi:hypothetical protein